MVAKGADNHVHPDAQGSYSCEKPCYQADRAKGFRHYGEKGKCCREAGFDCKHIHCGKEPGAAEPAKDLLHAVRKEYQCKEKPQHQHCGIIICLKKVPEHHNLQIRVKVF